MNNGNGLPRSEGGADDIIEIKAGTWNKLCDMVEQCRISVEAPLRSQVFDGGTLLGLAEQMPVRPIILRATETGGGFYKGDWQRGSPALAGGTSTLSLPFGNMQAGASNQVLIVNSAETGSTNHALMPVAGNTLYGAGLLIGRTQEVPSRDIAMFLSPQTQAVSLFPVLTTQTGGSAGNTTTACTFMYTVNDYFTSATLGTGIGLETPRVLKVQMTAATNGTAFWGMSGTTRVVKLWQAFEVMTQNSCS